MTICGVEDNDLVRELVTEMLERYGHRVMLCEGKSEGCMFKEGFPSDIVLFVNDIHIPCRERRCLASLPKGVLILHLTGDRRMFEQLEGHKLMKPFDLQDFHAAVEECLAEYEESR